MSSDDELVHKSDLAKHGNEQPIHKPTYEELLLKLEQADRKIEERNRKIEEGNRKIEEGNRKIEEGNRKIEEANRKTEQLIKEKEKAEELVKPTDYLSYLSLWHHKLFLSLKIQTNSELTSVGGAANVKDKRYPLYLKRWDDFPVLHDECQRRIETVFGEEKLFQPAFGVAMLAELFADGPVADEEDMRQFQCFAVEAATRYIANKYLHIQRQRASTESESSSSASAQPTKIRFLNNPYGLLALGHEDNGNDNGETPAYVPSMRAAIQQDMESRGRTDDDGPPPSKRQSSPRPRVYPDQWCFRVDTDGIHVPVFVIEYKAAHKLPAVAMQTALREDQEHNAAGDEDSRLFAEVIRELHSNKTSLDAGVKAQNHVKRITAQVIAQAFHYMIEFGLCHAYVASGQALLLLHLRPNDPQTLHYHLAVPATSVAPDPNKPGSQENVHNTAIALVLSLVVLSMETPVLTQRWKQGAYSVLKTWPEPYLEMELEGDSGSNSTDGADDDATGYKKPVLPAPATSNGCGDPTKTTQRRKDKDDDENGQDYRPPPSFSTVDKTLASRRNKRTSTNYSSSIGGGSSSSNQQRPYNPFCTPAANPLPYCTQACLVGLRIGGPLDMQCPNVQLHERTEMPGRHALTVAQFAKCMREQLAYDLDDDCEGLDKFGKFGATSMLFRLVLRPYGYSLVAKGVQRPHAHLLEHELGVYEDARVAPQQGRLVPVCLGIIELVCEYISYTGAHISHMLLLSYGGEPLWKIQDQVTKAIKANLPPPRVAVDMDQRVRQAWAQLRALGVLHGDERAPNAVWSEELQAVMCIDFGMAEMPKAPTRGVQSPKRRRPRKMRTTDNCVVPCKGEGVS